MCACRCGIKVTLNMAVAGLYPIGYSFWEFGTPDWDHTKYFLLWGVAEDHSSNPIKIGLDKPKRHGAKFVSINPVRTGSSAIADEWIPIRPGTDGLLALAIVHVLLTEGTIDFAFLSRYTNAPWLVIDAPGASDDGLFARDAAGNPLAYDESTGILVDALAADIRPALFGIQTLADGRTAKTVLALAAERYLDPEYAPERVAPECGVPADTIRRLAREMAQSRFARRSSSRSGGPTCGGARTTAPSDDPSRCTRCAVSRRTRTVSRRAARCT